MALLSDRRLARVNRAVVSGRILPFLAFATLFVTAAAGLAVRILAPNDFESIGEAMWWAAQTVTTVGYGDVVPDSTVGRTAAVVVMAFGVTALSLFTAVVTSTVISYQQRRLAEADKQPMAEVLERIERRLEAIESRLP
jgi:voltage-gated potassium channel